MSKIFSGISLFLMFLLAYAADEPVPVDTTVSESGEMKVLIFVVIFFGLILGYFAYVFWGRKKHKDDDKAK